MTNRDLIFGIVLLIAAVFLVVAVLLQQGKSHNSGAITGSSDTYYGKNKSSTKDMILSRVTTIVAIVFCLIVATMFIFQSKDKASTETTETTVDEEIVDTYIDESTLESVYDEYVDESAIESVLNEVVEETVA